MTSLPPSLAPPSSSAALRCACGERHTRGGWVNLQHVGTMDDGAGGRLDLRNCRCGSTISIMLPDSKPASLRGRFETVHHTFVR